MDGLIAACTKDALPLPADKLEFNSIWDDVEECVVSDEARRNGSTKTLEMCGCLQISSRFSLK